MNSFLNYARRSMMVLFQSGVLLVVISSCSKDVGNQIPEKNYSAEELYKGLIFLDNGNVLASIPELAELKGIVNEYSKKMPNSTNNQNRNDEILLSLKNYKPDFLETFKRDVTSGDPMKVESAMKNAANLTLEVLFASELGSTVPKESRSEFFSKTILHQEELQKLVSEFKKEKISEGYLKARISSIFGFEGHQSSKIISDLKSKKQASSGLRAAENEETCLALIYNVFYFINVVDGVNIEFAINIHQIKSFHTYVKVKVEFADLTSANKTELSRELLYASIAKNLS